MTPSWTHLRDACLFLSGLAGVYHEIVLRAGERPTILLLLAAMIGLPAFLRADAGKKDE